MNTNDVLTSIRALAPDLCAILDETGPLGERVDPVVVDYLEARCPGWRASSRWVRAHCAACDRPVTRPVRETRTCTHEAEVGLVPQGAFIWCRDIEGYASGWLRSEREDLCVHPRDALWATVDDGGCCGYSGTPGNTACVCGARLGRTHTDCCGPAFFCMSRSSVRLRWGLPAATDEDRALLARFEGLGAEEAEALLRSTPGPPSAVVDAALTERFGRSAHMVFEALEEGLEAGWAVQWRASGCWVIYDEDLAVVRVEVREEPQW